MKEFVLTVCAAAAVSAAVNGLRPDGGLKKYAGYIISLAMLISLMSPFKSIVSALPSLVSETAFWENYSWDGNSEVEKLAAQRIRLAVCEKFSVPESQIDCRVSGRTASLSVKKRLGLIAQDIELFVKMNFGLEAEAVLYE